jgi:hypothetical protein
VLNDVVIHQTIRIAIFVLALVFSDLFSVVDETPDSAGRLGAGGYGGVLRASIRPRMPADF